MQLDLKVLREIVDGLLDQGYTQIELEEEGEGLLDAYWDYITSGYPMRLILPADPDKAAVEAALDSSSTYTKWLMDKRGLDCVDAKVTGRAKVIAS